MLNVWSQASGLLIMAGFEEVTEFEKCFLSEYIPQGMNRSQYFSISIFLNNFHVLKKLDI